MAVIQGITEWLPISSTGHLVLAQAAMGIPVPAAFDVVLHIGTLLSILYFMRNELTGLAKSAMKREREGVRLVSFVVLGTLPAALMGFLFKAYFESLVGSVYVVATGLLFSGLLLFLSEMKVRNGQLDGGKSLAIGMMQAIAIIPGVSRSGATISCGLMLGVKKETAARFSFLLSIPVVVGAMLLELGGLANSQIDPLLVLTGVIVSAAVGYASLKLLWNTILARKFHLFAYYCWAVALLVMLPQMLI